MGKKNKIESRFSILSLILALVILLSVFALTLGDFGVDVAYASTPVLDSADYDAYTDSDSFVFNNNSYTIRDYKNSLSASVPTMYRSGTATVTGGIAVYGSDPITKIIPKNLFAVNGKHLYIGKEYGFYVYTVSDARISSNKHSFVYVFDITVSMGSASVYDESYIDYKVEPLFQREYKYLNYSNSATMGVRLNSESQNIAFTGTLNYNFTSDVASAVIAAPQIGDSGNILYNELDLFYLSGIKLGATLENVQSKNKEDAGYVPQSDDGAFFIGSDYIFQGYKREQNELSTGEKIGSLAEWGFNSFIGYVPVVGGAISNLLTFKDLLERLDSFSTVTWTQTGSDYGRQALQVSKASQIAVYGGLQKEHITTYAPDNSDVWFGENCYSMVRLYINHGDADNFAEATRLHFKPVLSIYSEVSSLQAQSPDGSDGTVQAPSHFVDIYGNNYKSIAVGADGNSETNDIYVLSKGTARYQFTPNYSSYYNLEFGNADGLITSLRDANGSVSPQDEAYLLKAGVTYNLLVSNGSVAKKLTTMQFMIKAFDVTAGTQLSVVVPGAEVNPGQLYLKILPQAGALGISEVSADVSFRNILDYVGASDVNFASSEAAVISDGSARYVLLQNLANNPATVTLAFNNVQSFTGGKDFSVSINNTSATYYSFYQLTDIPTGYSYLMLLQRINGSTDYPKLDLYDGDGTLITMSRGMPSDDISEPNWEVCKEFQNEYSTIYVALRGVTSVKLTFKEFSIAGYWYVDGVKVTGTEIHLKRGNNYTIRYKLFNGENYPVTSETSPTDLLYFDAQNSTLNIDQSVEMIVNTTNLKAGEKELKIIVGHQGLGNYSFSVGADGGIYLNLGHYGDLSRIKIRVNNVLYEIVAPSSNYILLDSLFANGSTLRQKLRSYMGSRITSALFNIESYDAEYISEGVSHSYSYTSVNYDFNSPVDILFAFDSISGTYYYISNKEHLYNIRYFCNTAADSNNSFYIKNDIDLGGRAWTPIPVFYGTLISFFKTIKNYTLDVDTIVNLAPNGGPYVGFIARNFGKINLVYFSGITITSVSVHNNVFVYVGAVAGYNAPGGELLGVAVNHFNITVHRDASSVGGAVGKNEGSLGTIGVGLQEQQKSKIFGNGDVGGVTGTNTGSIENCNVKNTDIEAYSVYTSRSYGGIVGYMSGGRIKNASFQNGVMRHVGSSTAISPCMGYIIGCASNCSIYPATITIANVSNNLGNLANHLRNRCFPGAYNGMYGELSNVTMKT